MSDQRAPPKGQDLHDVPSYTTGWESVSWLGEVLGMVVGVVREDFISEESTHEGAGWGHAKGPLVIGQAWLGTAGAGWQSLI